MAVHWIEEDELRVLNLDAPGRYEFKYQGYTYYAWCIGSEIRNSFLGWRFMSIDKYYALINQGIGKRNCREKNKKLRRRLFKELVNQNPSCNKIDKKDKNEMKKIRDFYLSMISRDVKVENRKRDEIY